MSITRGVLAQSHDKVLDNNPDRIGIWKCWFLRRGENRSTRRKTSRSKDENQQQTQRTYDAGSGREVRGLRGKQMLNHCAIPAPPDVIQHGQRRTGTRQGLYNHHGT